MGLLELRNGPKFCDDELSLPLFETADEIRDHRRMVPDDAVLNVELPSQELPSFLSEDSYFPVVVTQVRRNNRIWEEWLTVIK